MSKSKKPVQWNMKPELSAPCVGCGKARTYGQCWECRAKVEKRLPSPKDSPAFEGPQHIVKGPPEKDRE